MPGKAKAIAVFCGSAFGTDERYTRLARGLGEEMARREHSLVYGGGHVGLMGTVANALIENNGYVVGVIPRLLREKELALETCDELIETTTMHERKAVMAERADAFVALPGGFGTLEEILEVITHFQLRIHSKPCVLLNEAGYYDPLITQFEAAFDAGFAREEHRSNYHVTRSITETLDFIERFEVT